VIDAAQKTLRQSRLAYGLDLAGVGLFAVSGALAGIHRGLDLFGIAVIAAVTGMGGGTLRDVVLGRHPILWIRDPKYLYVILLAAAIAVIGQSVLPNLETAFLVADAMGLALFALSGAQSVEEDHAWIIIVVMGTMSGVAGGVIRDVLSGIAPLLLRRDVYATAAIGGICLYLVLQQLGVKRTTAFFIGIAAVVAIRLLSLKFQWQLPAFA
jgi:uncharacterized membrane protein YeiH